MAELADAIDLGSIVPWRAGSSPVIRMENGRFLGYCLEAVVFYFFMDNYEIRIYNEQQNAVFSMVVSVKKGEGIL